MNSHQHIFLTGSLSKAEEPPLWEICLKFTEQAVAGEQYTRTQGTGNKRNPGPEAPALSASVVFLPPTLVRTHSMAPVALEQLPRAADTDLQDVQKLLLLPPSKAP